MYYMANIFNILSNLSMNDDDDDLTDQDLGWKILYELAISDIGTEKISECIYYYATSLRHLCIDEIVHKFYCLHDMFKLVPTYSQFHKLLNYCCNADKIDTALGVTNRMCEAGVTLQSETVNTILYQCRKFYKHGHLVYEIYSLILRNQIKPDCDTFEMMIKLFVGMNNFKGAYDMINDLKKFNLKPTPVMYDLIIMGYLRRGNKYAAVRVLKE